MISRVIAEFAMRGLVQTVLLIVGFTVLAFVFPPAGIVGGAIVALVALRSGTNPGVYAVAASSVVLAAILIAIGMKPLMAFIAGVVQWVPILLLAVVLRLTLSWQMTVQAGLVVCLFGVLMLNLVFPDLISSWQNLLEQYLKPVIEQTGRPEEEITQLMKSLSSQMTGLIWASVFLSGLLALMLGRYMQASLYNPGGFGEEFQEFRSGRWPAVGGLILIAMSFAFSSSLLDELLLVLGVVFFLQGAAVVYNLVKRRSLAKQWSLPLAIIVAVMFVIMLGPIVTMLSGLGMADAFADFRKRLIKTSN